MFKYSHISGPHDLYITSIHKYPTAMVHFAPKKN